MRPIRTLLVANRGEIARRVMRTAHQMGIATVAVFSDADSRAPHVREADRAVRLPGNTPADTYLRSDLIIDAARATGADAVHPGYGFLSENADFAAACGRAGITFVGPSPSVIEQMGSKVAAKELLAAAGVPVLPSFTVTETMSPADVAAAAADIGHPVLVKAAYGGGGRGMRIVRAPDDLAASVAAAQREAAAAFGNGLVFVERYVEAPRHIEVQIFGDHHGTVISLFERECSIQRRHQKIVEEAPSPAVSDERRESLCAAARAAAESLGYVGAGTVEFVMDGAGDFYFLEVNTRLQVEHPVTEMITGLDLVRLQLEVAEGRPLSDAARTATIRGHAIEARLYAEDVAAGFLPLSGPIDRLRIPAMAPVRVDSGYEDGSAVSTFYDAMLAKVIAWAPSRAEAAAVLADALAAAELHGVGTNRSLLVATLRHPDFAAGRTDTAFYERNDPAALSEPAGGADTQHLLAVAVALGMRPEGGPQPPGLPRAWRNVGASITTTDLAIGEERLSVSVRRDRADTAVSVDGQTFVPVTVLHAAADHVEFELAGVRHRVRLHRLDGVVYADGAGGASTFHLVERFPIPAPHVAAGSLLAPMPGTVAAVHAAAGDTVAAGQALVALEAMKMEHSIRAPVNGVLSEMCVAVGDQVEGGAVLAVVSEVRSD